MASATLVAAALCLFFVPATATPRPCTSNDYVRQMLPCDEKTLTRSVVYYLNSNCTGGAHAPWPIHGLPCYCSQGEGLASDGKECASCKKGEFGSGGEVINNWNMWTENGTKPPESSDMFNYCEFTRPFNSKYVCNPWKASVDNYTLESGEHSGTRCVSSVLLMTKKFIQPNSNKVSFDYRVDSRYCRGVYYGCDGLAFFVNNKMILDYSGSQFQWTTLTYYLKPGTHTLKWVYHKSCYSYGISFVDKAFIRSITLVGTEEPNLSCTKCPPGYYSKIGGAFNCTACSYFEYQSKEGQQQCEVCPQDTYSMLGASKCLPLPNCTDDDIIKAPDNCSCPSGDKMCMTTVVPSYVKVRGFKTGPRLLCKNQDDSKLKPQLVQCRCQPGYQLVNSDDGKKQCNLCGKGSFSTDGITCAHCEPGHVALQGKHFYVWRNNTLPAGFSTDCFGDCSVKGGWIPAGGDIRTERVVGDMLTVLTSPEVEIVSELGKIMFNCSVTCNLTGVAPKGTPGEHLSKINDCNLIFRVFRNEVLSEQVNCSYPRGGYQYRHEKNRDGRIMKHILPLEKGRYFFRWIFYQQDETLGLSTAFEGKVYNISIVGTKDGSALNCTPCPAGYYSTKDNTDCAICPNGTASKKGSAKCNPCEGNSFAAKMGSETCLPCGANTTVYPGKDGCDTNGCKFTPAEGVEYDLSGLSREDGPMIKALLYRVQSQSRRSYPYRTVIWPYRPSLYFNLCTLKHDNSSCVGPWNMTTGQRDPLPVMACRSSWGRRDIDIGSVIGYRAKKDDVRSGLFVELSQGDLCYYGRDSQRRYKTTLDLRCNMYADVGNPGPENNRTGYYFKFPCEYFLVWESMYACPKCQGHEVEKVVGECINGTRNVTFVRSVPCWGTGRRDEIEVPIEPCPVVAAVNDTTVVYHTERSSGNAIKIVIGVCVTVILVLLGIVLFFVYRHRTMKYRYFNSLARDKPMSRLAEEDELDEQFNESSPCS